MSKKTYNFLFPTAQIVLPGAGALYFLLGLFFDVPAEIGVLGTLSIATSGLGLILRASKTRYDGNVVVQKDPSGKTIFSLELDGDPNEIENMDSISFKVVLQEDYDNAD